MRQTRFEQEVMESERQRQLYEASKVHEMARVQTQLEQAQIEKEHALQDLHIERINLTRLKEEWLSEKRKMTRLIQESRQEILRDRGELELQRNFFETSQEEQGLALSKEKAQIQVGTEVIRLLLYRKSVIV